MKSDTEQLELQENASQKRQRNTQRRIFKEILFVLFFLVIWGVLVYEGFYFTKQYFDQTINNLQQTNAFNIQEVSERLAGLNSEVQALQRAISNTDETLSSSGDIQEELNQKIELLDKQLRTLEKSLDILKEAP